jgi:hypothetical protein
MLVADYAANGGIELRHDHSQEFLFLMGMKISLLHSGSAMADRGMRAARRIAADLTRRRHLLLHHLTGLQIREFRVTGILQKQRFAAVANNDPLALIDLHGFARHQCLLVKRPRHHRRIWVRLAFDQRRTLQSVAGIDRDDAYAVDAYAINK